MSEREVRITVRVALIRDGTQGISLSAPDSVLGEWQDSGAAMLRIAAPNAVSICGADGNKRYDLAIPGTIVSLEQLSDTEAVAVTRIQ